MPGLAGLFDAEAAPEALGACVSRMGRTLAHSQGHQVACHTQGPLAVARAALGIFNRGPQPGRADAVLAWVEGELYGYKRRALTTELRAAGHPVAGDNDAELVAGLYAIRGPAFLRDLDGTFSLVVYDQRQNRVLLAVDRAVTRPMHYTVQAGRLWFASEVKALLQDPRVPRVVDEQGWAEFFTFRHPLADHTLLRDIHYLPAGHLAQFEAGRLTTECYWAPTVAASNASRASLLADQAAAMRQALERQMSDDASLGLFLSGGLDSRQLAGSLPPRPGKFHTFSRGPVESWDVKFGMRVARQVGSTHHHLDLKPDFLARYADRGVWLTDGLMTATDIYILSIIEQVRPHVEVVMFGMGLSSGLSSGIALSPALLQARTVDEAIQVFFTTEGVYLPRDLQARLLPARFLGDLRAATAATLRRTVEALPATTPAGLIEAFCVQCRWPRSSGYGPLLARTQVETRAPYSDPDYFAAVSRTPAKWRARRQMQIGLLRHTRPDLARLPWEFTGLPVDISSPPVIFLQRGLYALRRRASRLTGGLIPAGTERERANYPVWFRTALRPWLEDVLLDPRTLDRGLFNPDVVRQMVADHMASRADNSHRFGLLLTYELWSRLFIDGEGLGAAAPASVMAAV